MRETVVHYISVWSFNIIAYDES